ncbi:MAG TPA: hypothetical protein VEH57_00645 [Thermoplasmata archaeon]|nr:hypothetical protein [Thermoplasmata archaeon]
MQQEKARGFRGFVQTAAGRAFLIALSLVLVFATFTYVTPLLAIPVFLIVGLALPIYSGLKRPRFLALSGLVVILLLAPVATAVLSSEIMSPTPAASSSPDLPEGHGGAVLQNASVGPFLGSTSTNFTWNVTIYPQYLSPDNSSPLWLSLYISTCPGATGNSSPVCSAGYPFYNRTITFPSGYWANHTGPTRESFRFTIGSNGIWDWQMGLAMENLSTHGLEWIFLVGDPQYDGIEGPVIGGYGTVYFALIGSVYLESALYLGAPYFIVLLIYVAFKNRERRRADSQRRRAGPVPPTSPPPAGPKTPLPSGPPPESSAAATAAAAAAAGEMTCPNCHAVVYANEATCWKCGTALNPKG